MSLNLGVNLISYHCVRAGKLLNQCKHTFCALVVVRQANVKMIIIYNRSGKQLNRIAALAGLNHLDSSNGSGCVLPITALNRLLHLLNNIGHLALGALMLEIPAGNQSKQQSEKRCDQCLHARSGLTIQRRHELRELTRWATTINDS